MPCSLIEKLMCMDRLIRWYSKGEFMRTLVTLACTECKRRNYTTKKNKQNNPDRLEFKKYCKWCGHHTLHKETR